MNLIEKHFRDAKWTKDYGVLLLNRNKLRVILCCTIAILVL